ncbi:glutathione binding-like protein [Parvibaculum sp.]|uniref:glutathione binding-like protein n=1 Tax=Parvibaculum sp. TaxID=2024848 RepID=UPI001B2A61FA|nr:glutathione binding-like protein [Parvibaculum sp.]MBO6679851.1 glutathione S-transferase family protein [Parvibaculum sp.]MBO6683788.1 glutathione S-transferase family protein [Parvibaculum sp.]MBO6905378.1 glutathione S-transferase family protein [Parvibaculum sp.]
MELYFTPMACSIATRIALHETGRGDATSFHRVTLSTKTLDDGTDYYAVNPKGQVPALRLDDGEILTEGTAILQYVADLAPDAGIAPVQGSVERYRLQEWLNFVGTELHKQVLAAIFNPFAPEEMKAYAREKVAPVKFEVLSKALEDKDFLVGGRFTVADAYAWFVLSLAGHAGIDLARWPSLTRYFERLSQRPSIARAAAEEMALMNPN